MLEDAKFIVKVKSLLSWVILLNPLFAIFFALFSYALSYPDSDGKNFFQLLSELSLIVAGISVIIWFIYRRFYIYINYNAYSSDWEIKRVCKFLGIRRNTLKTPYLTLVEISEAIGFKINIKPKHKLEIAQDFILFLNQNYLESDSAILSRKRAKEVIPIIQEKLPGYFPKAVAKKKKLIERESKQKSITSDSIRALHNQFETTSFSGRLRGDDYKIIAQFLSQCERLKVREARLNQLVAYDGATYLESTMGAFGEIRCLFEKDAKIIAQYLIIDGYMDDGDGTTAKFKNEHYNEIMGMVNENYEILNSVDNLLDTAVRLISKFNADADNRLKSEDILASLSKQAELLERMSTKSFRLDE